jgi:hypothetical protein
MVIGRIPVPGSVVAEAHIDTPRSIVTGHEPPYVRVEIPARLDEDVVHPLDDAVPVDPKVIAVAVGPVAVDPDRPWALHLGLHHHDRLRSRRCLLRRRQRFGLLNDDHRFAVDDLGGAVIGFDDHVGRRVGRCAGLTFSLVAIVRDIEPIASRPSIAVSAFVVGGRGCGQRHRCAKRAKKNEPNEGIHDSSFICMSFWALRHPPGTEQARPARQMGWKVLGFRRF